MQTEKKSASAVGLDVGTSRIVTARPGEKGVICSAQLNAFVDLPWSKLTAKTLLNHRVPHSIEAERIVVHGTESARFADLLGVETRRSMSKGLVNPNEPESVQRIRKIIELVVGKAECQGQPLCFSVPAVHPGAEENATFHQATLMQILTELGYSANSITEGLAVVYAELEKSNYTGVGISFGGGLTNVCLAYLSVPVATFSLAKAGDYIDSSAAVATGELANRIRLRKEDTFYFNGAFGDSTLQALAVYYEELIETIVAAMAEQFEPCCRTGRFKTPVPVVLSGGSAMPRGFRDRFEEALRAGNLSLEISEVRLAANPLETTARGALIAALTESE
jgi:hypothetical protein